MKYVFALLLFFFSFSLFAQTSLSGTISTNTTWGLVNSPYEVTGDVTVQSGVTLTIEAGVVIGFPVYSTDVIVEGTLIAVGTSMNPITLNGPGGIDLSENSVSSQVAYMQYNGVGATSGGSTDNTFGAGISIGGSVSSFTNVTFDNCMTCLTIYNNASPTIDQCTFDGSTTAGLTSIEGNPVITNSNFDSHSLYGVEFRLGTPTLQTNTISNSTTALYLNGVLTNPVIENNTFTGNTRDIITHPELLDDELYNGNGFTKVFVNDRTINASTTWHKVESPETWVFEGLGLIQTTTGITLTMEPGFEINLTHYTHDVEVEGTLVANGTVSDPIKINGPGGIDISENSTNSQVSYLQYQGVGATSGGSADRTLGGGLSIGGINASVSNSSFLNTMYGLVVYNDAAPAINESVFDVSNTYGLLSMLGNPTITNSDFDNHPTNAIELRAGSVTLQDNTFDNNGTALRITGVLSNPVIENNTFTSNTSDIITHPELLDDEFYDGNGFSTVYVGTQTISASTTWHKVQSPETWTFQGLGRIPTNTGITLTMEPGFEITLTNYTHDIEVEGTLMAVGTESDSIKINGPGGIDISENSTNSQVAYLKFQGVGATSSGSSDRTLGGGLSVGGANAMVQNSSFLNSAIGIVVYNNASPSISTCEIATAASFGIRVQNGTSAPVIDNTSFSNTAIQAIQNLGSGTTIATSNWWGDPTGPYNMAANPTGLGEEVSDGVTFDPWLTTDPLLEISIDSQPTDQLTCEGGNVAYAISASGANNLTYQWQIDMGSGFENLMDDATYSGTNTTQLTVTAPATSLNMTSYRCVVAGDNADDATSDAVTLEVTSLVNITAQPVNTEALIGEQAILSVAASGDNINYQWQKDGINISGATSSDLTISSSSKQDEGMYQCVISNGCNSITSTEVTLSVCEPVSISSQPQDETINVGESVTFDVTAEGDNVSYQWQKDGVDISGANTGTLSIASVQLSDAGSYTCSVTGDCGTIASDEAVLIVNKPLNVNEAGIQLMVYPNPSSEKLYVDGLSSRADWSITFIHISGKSVHQEPLMKGPNQIEVSSLPKGVYLITIGTGKEEVFSERILIK